jgi:hypothetical protein
LKFSLHILRSITWLQREQISFSRFLLSSLICWILFRNIVDSFEDFVWVIIFWCLSNSLCERFSIFNNFLKIPENVFSKRKKLLFYSSVRMDLCVWCKNRLIRISKRRWRLFNFISSFFKAVIWLEYSINFIRSVFWKMKIIFILIKYEYYFWSTTTLTFLNMTIRVNRNEF